MKRIFAGLTAALLLAALLAGCGSKTEEAPAADNGAAVQDQQQAEQQAPVATQPVEQQPVATQPVATQPVATQPVVTQPLQEVPVGTVLDAPEVVFTDNCEKLYIYFSSPDTTGKTTSVELALDQITQDTYVIYFSDGLLKNHEVVYEVSDAGITAYYRMATTADFVQDTTSTQTELEEQVNGWLEMMSYLTLLHPDYAAWKYRKSDAQVASLTGEVLVYDILEDGQVTGQVCVDKATGVMSSLKEADGSAVFTVHQIKTSDLGIPTYK